MELSELDKLMEQYEQSLAAKKGLEAEAKLSGEVVDRLEQEILEAMVAAGTQNYKTARGYTFFRRTETYFSPKARVGVDGNVLKNASGVTVTLRDDLINALANHPTFMDLVAPNYNANSLQSRLREWLRNNEELPKELAPLVNVTTVEKLGVNSSGAKGR